jgi:hypothetical protein
MMDRLTRIFSSAIAFQGARTQRNEIRGLDKTPEGIEFAKSMVEGVFHGIPAETMVIEVTKAMCGDEKLALELMESVQEITKAQVEAHTRTEGGKVIQVHAYETARQKAMVHSYKAAAATLHAFRTKTPEAHENAAAAHEEAMKAHSEAHEAHPPEDPESGTLHAKDREVHRSTAELHRSTASDLRNGEAYQHSANKAEGLSNLASQVGTSAMAENRHMAAAAAHREAHGKNPNMGHMERAQSHEAFAKASRAFDTALHSDIPSSKDKYDALDLSGKALRETQTAHQANTPKAHERAAEAHGKAAEAHMALHGKHESSEDGTHGQVARHHIDLHAYHTKMAQPTVAKASTELAGQTGTEATMVEGRPDEKQAECTISKADPGPDPLYTSDEQVIKAIKDWDAENREKLKEGKIKGEFAGPHESFPINSPKDITHAYMLAHHAGDPAAIKAHLRSIAEAHGWTKHLPEEEEEKVAKAHVEAHSRTQGGKVVQVASYDTHKQAAMEASHAAHTATATAQTPEQHTSAAAGHMKAAVAQREAGKYAPESWQEKGHEAQAELHETYAQAHHAKAKAAGNRADTGVDQPPHTAQDVKNLEQHPDYQGFGYLGHSNRTDITDEQVAEAANKAGLKPHELAAHLLSKSGRHMMDNHGGDTPPGQAVAKFQQWMTDPKNKKHYDIDSYAKELASYGGLGKKEPAAKEVDESAPEHNQGHVSKYKPGVSYAPSAYGEMRELPEGSKPGLAYPSKEAKAEHLSKKAAAASDKAAHAGTPEAFKAAGEAHMAAQDMHSDATKRDYHSRMADQHFGQAEEAKKKAAAEPGGKEPEKKPAPKPAPKPQGNPALQGELAGKAEAAGRAVMESADKKSEEANKDWGGDHQGAYNAHNGAKMAHKTAADQAMKLGLTDKAKHHSEMAFKHVDKMLEHEKALAAAKGKKK